MKTFENPALDAFSLNMYENHFSFMQRYTNNLSGINLESNIIPAVQHPNSSFSWILFSPCMSWGVDWYFYWDNWSHIKIKSDASPQTNNFLYFLFWAWIILNITMSLFYCATDWEQTKAWIILTDPWGKAQNVQMLQP